MFSAVYTWLSLFCTCFLVEADRININISSRTLTMVKDITKLDKDLKALIHRKQITIPNNYRVEVLLIFLSSSIISNLNSLLSISTNNSNKSLQTTNINSRNIRPSSKRQLTSHPLKISSNINSNLNGLNIFNLRCLASLHWLKCNNSYNNNSNSNRRELVSTKALQIVENSNSSYRAGERIERASEITGQII